MHEEHRKIIVKAIEDGFAFKQEYSNYEINSNFQLLLTQLDLFKTISTLVVAIIGIGYFLNNEMNSLFFGISFLFSLVTIIGTISYTRETIDSKAKQIQEEGVVIRKKMDDAINKAVESIKSENSKIYFDYIEQESKSKESINRLIYAGEIFTFCFYLSIAFGLLGLFAKKYGLEVISYWTVLVLVSVYLISFKDWARCIIDALSKDIKTCTEHK